MRKTLCLLLTLLITLACASSALADTTIANGAFTLSISASDVSHIGWAPDQDLSGIYVTPTGDGLRVEAPVTRLSTRGDAYQRYFDVPISISVGAGMIHTDSSFANIRLYIDHAPVSTHALKVTAGHVDAQTITATARVYARGGGSTTVIQAVYTDGNVSESYGLFFAPEASAAKTVYFIDRDGLTSAANAVYPQTVGTNANRSRAEWSPGLDAIRVFIDYTGLENVTVYRQDNGTNYRLVDTKITLLKNGVPYPNSTPVLVEMNPVAELGFGTGALKGKMKLGQDYFFQTLFENDRNGYLGIDGSFTIRFFLRDDQDVLDSFRHIFDQPMTQGPIAVYIREVTGHYSEKRFDFRVNASYMIGTGGITIPGSLTLRPGESTRFSVLYGDSYTMDKIVYWTSSDPSVVAVYPDGTVTAIREGVAVVNARTSVEGKEAYSIISVRNDGIPPATPPTSLGPAPSGATVTGTLYVVTDSRLTKFTGPGASYAKMRSYLARGDVIAVTEITRGYARFRQGGVVCYADAAGMQPLR